MKRCACLRESESFITTTVPNKVYFCSTPQTHDHDDQTKPKKKTEQKNPKIPFGCREKGREEGTGEIICSWNSYRRHFSPLVSLPVFSTSNHTQKGKTGFPYTWKRKHQNHWKRQSIWIEKSRDCGMTRSPIIQKRKNSLLRRQLKKKGG